MQDYTPSWPDAPTEGWPVCIPLEVHYIPALMGSTCTPSWPGHLGSCRGGAQVG